MTINEMMSKTEFNTALCIFIPYRLVEVIVVVNSLVSLDVSGYFDSQPHGEVPAAGYYTAVAWDEPDIRLGNVPELFVIGDGSMRSAGDLTYVNTRLDSDTVYKTFVRYSIAPDNVGDDALFAYSNITTTQTGEAMSAANIILALYVISACSS